MVLTAETIRGHLKARGLSVTGTKKTLAQRLRDNLQTSGHSGSAHSSRASHSSHSGSSDSSDSSDGALSPGSRAPARNRVPFRSQTRHGSESNEEDGRSTAHWGSGSRRSSQTRTSDSKRSSRASSSQRRASSHHGSHSSQRTRHREHSRSSHRTKERSRSHQRSYHSSRHHRRSRRRTPSSSVDSSSSRSHSKRHKRRASFSDSSSGLSSDLEDAYTAPCLPFRTPPPRRIQEKIRKGKYVSFSRLLEKSMPTMFSGGKLPPTQGQRSRKVHDLASWLEAWNIYLPIRIAHDPSCALELATYQGILSSLFASFEASACIEYDRLFRHQAARDKSLRWDILKEDLFVFQATNAQRTPFRKVFARLGPQPDQGANRESHTPSGVEICRRFNQTKCTLGENCRFAHKCWIKGCGGSHPAKGCSFKPRSSQ